LREVDTEIESLKGNYIGVALVCIPHQPLLKRLFASVVVAVITAVKLFLKLERFVDVKVFNFSL
jgi:hypothetical protein